ncbi:LANO_0D05248g1_1 [Lachancea nothofagi CBS 11611]|uniref:LANO_0D05248g1_1 n=1 Tax=Lachancea nothofagi CBS 11611 TaxID=1266666 RepID=A0A1G4JGN4_9SACH|nr:LANO_0D05248g1_1 [Lachancea nothofagi CBS 11611]
MTSLLWVKQPASYQTSQKDDEQELRPFIGVTGTFPMMEHSHTKDEFTDEQGKAEMQTTKEGIILNPQPSESKRDPLNWPIWRRDLALIVVGWHCFVGGGQTSILAAGTSGLAKEFDRSLSDISYLVGAMMLALAAGSVVASPTAVLFGKRVVYLVGIIVFFAGSIGCAVSPNYESLLASRVVSGFGVATIESLPSATVAEIYFAHERAYRLGFYTLLLLGGKNLVPLLASLVFEHLNRHWLFWIVTIIVGINFMLHLFFVPETFWDRAPVPGKRSLQETAIARAIGSASSTDADSNSNHNVDHTLPTSMQDDDASLIQPNTPQPLQPEVASAIVPRPRRYTVSSFTQSHLTVGLGIFHGRHSEDKWYMVMVRPFVLFAYPAVLFGAFLYSLAIVWLIMIAQIVDRVYSSAPYNFSATSVGLVYLSPFIGGVLGSLCGGGLSDILIRNMARRNGGVYEPEFRLLMVLPACISTALGLIGFGWCAHNQDPWIAPTIFLGVVGFGSSLASTTAITYTVDSYKLYAQEALVSLNVLKNVMGFAFSFFNANFNAQQGYKTAFVVYGCVEIFVGLFAIPLYHYGKKARHWTDSKGLLSFSYVSKDTDDVSSNGDLTDEKVKTGQEC